ncbi:MAG: amidohydrolase family protein [Candidatus Nanohaloarchaeota archaeon QJJ-7]|nr:amidohydrolase family protein [Candidatus Nanohaloarchaeota archaeon QJJ-7]
MDRRFYDLDIQSELSSGDDSIQELADRAKKLGFDGLAVSDYVAEEKDIERTAQAIEGAEAPLDLHLGAKLRPEDPEDLKDMLRRFRERVEVVVVHGGDAEVNRAASSDSRVDVLAHPERDRTDSGLDHVIARQAAENNVAVQLNLRQLLETYGKVRMHVLSHMRRNVRLCEHFGAPLIASSGASSVWHLRAPRELSAFPRILGLDLKESFGTVAEVPERVLERAEEVTSDEFVRPGVEVVQD